MEIGTYLIDIGDHFIDWLPETENKHKLMTTIKHFKENKLIAGLNIRQSSTFTIFISGEDDEYDDGITFDFYMHHEGQWRFGIQIVDNPVKSDLLDLSGFGYGRFMMAIMIYCLDFHIKKPTDMIEAGDQLTIGICADSSDGFWDHIGMMPGKYTMDTERRNSKTGPAGAGYDKEFLMGDWKRWVFDGLRGALKHKKPKSKKKRNKPKKHKKPKNTKRKKKSKNTKRKKN